MKGQILNVNLKYELPEEGEFYAGNRADGSSPFVSVPNVTCLPYLVLIFLQWSTDSS